MGGGSCFRGAIKVGREMCPFLSGVIESKQTYKAFSGETIQSLIQ